MQGQTESCPWCGSPISREKFVAIQARIRAEEQKKLAEAERAMRERLQVEFARNLDKEKQAAALAAKKDADKRLAATLEEKDKAIAKLKEAEAREAKLRNDVKGEIANKLKASQRLADQQRQKELTELRQILDKDRDTALLKKQAEFAREREAFQKKFLEMERQLQRKTANEIGDGAEIDLLETLREAFPGDRFTRIKKGQPGADILHEVLHKAEICGKIVYDSKNRQAWQYTFVTKLREDQLEAEAEHAVLSTTIFPAGKKELCIEEDVVVVHPARVVHIVHLLRQAMVAMHVRGLSMRERTTKTDKLYRLITSDAYQQRIDQVARLADELLDIDVQEKKSHDGIWKKRGALLMRQSNLLREIDTEIAAIIEGADENFLPAAS